MRNKVGGFWASKVGNVLGCCQINVSTCTSFFHKRVCLLGFPSSTLLPCVSI